LGLWWVDLGCPPGAYPAALSLPLPPPQHDRGRKYNKKAHGLR